MDGMEGTVRHTVHVCVCVFVLLCVHACVPEVRGRLCGVQFAAARSVRSLHAMHARAVCVGRGG